jgi:hypothetical protein
MLFFLVFWSFFLVSKQVFCYRSPYGTKYLAAVLFKEKYASARGWPRNKRKFSFLATLKYYSKTHQKTLKKPSKNSQKTPKKSKKIYKKPTKNLHLDCAIRLLDSARSVLDSKKLLLVSVK